MHSTSVSSSASSSRAPTASNHDSYGCPPISTMRRHSRPNKLDLPLADDHQNSHIGNPGIYSAPIYHMKAGNHPPAYFNQLSAAPYTSVVHSQVQHLPPPSHSVLLPTHHHSLHLYTQTVDPYSQLHDTPHTFPLQTSQNHPQQYFHFPSAQPSISDQHSRLHSRQTSQEPGTWSNSALNPFMIERMNETTATMSIVDDNDDDEDPSASIDALVGDDESSSSDLLHPQVNKAIHSSNPTAITSVGAISPSLHHTYLRGTSHMLTTPPNPLASDDHPDNQLAAGQNFAKALSPLPSAGFELSATSNNATRGTMSGSKAAGLTSCFTFDDHLNERSRQAHENTTSEHLTKGHAGNNTDVRTTMTQDDSSNQSSSNSSSHKTSSRVLSKMLHSSGSSIVFSLDRNRTIEFFL